MKLFAVFEVEFHSCNYLLGVYDSEELAKLKQKEFKESQSFVDDIIIKEITLNQDIDI